MKITFHAVGDIPNEALRFAVIMAEYKGQWILCRHKERSTWEIPGGHREPGEAIVDTAQRELREETGAVQFTLTPLCVYGVEKEGAASYGLLCHGDVTISGPLPDSEIAETKLCTSLPQGLTYPEIQPHLFAYVMEWRSNQPQKGAAL